MIFEVLQADLTLTLRSSSCALLPFASKSTCSSIFGYLTSIELVHVFNEQSCHYVKGKTMDEVRFYTLTRNDTLASMETISQRIKWYYHVR